MIVESNYRIKLEAIEPDGVMEPMDLEPLEPNQNQEKEKIKRKRTGENLPYNPKKVPNVWQCCGKTFLSQSGLNSHKCVAHPDAIKRRQNAFFCKCGEKFQTYKSLSAHKKSGNCQTSSIAEIPFEPQIIDGSWTCCGVAYATKRLFNRHKYRIHPSTVRCTPTYCPICRQEFDRLKSLAEHKKEGNCQPPRHFEFTSKATKVDGNWQCCGITFWTKYSYGQHRRTIHPEAMRQYTCHVCGMKFDNRNGYNEHQKLENCEVVQSSTFNPEVKKDLSGKVYRMCCGKLFSKSAFHDHKQIVHPDQIVLRVLKCAICQGTVLGHKDLSLHYKTYHPKDKKLYNE